LLEQSSAFPNRIVQFEQVEKAPRESERKWLLLKNPCDVVLNLDREGTILFINPPLPGYTIEDTIGKTIYDFIPSKQHKMTRKAIKEVFKTGEVVSFETSVFGPDGILLRYSTHLSPVKNCNKVVCVAQVFTNITKRKKAKEETKEYKTISGIKK
jgi:PAS domain S-box-containing protein